MRLVRQASVLVKIAIPLVALGILAIGLVLYARVKLEAVAAQTREFIEVLSVRQEAYLRYQMNLSEAGLMSRNIILETNQAEMARYKGLYQAASERAYQSVNTLANLAETPARRKIAEELRGLTDYYLSVLNRSVEYGLRNDNAVATEILLQEAPAARARLNTLVDQRTRIIAEQMQAGKQALDAEVSSTIGRLIAFTVIGLGLAAILCGSIVVFGITRPLARLVAILRRMAQGEIDADIAEARRGDEIGAVGKAVDGIKTMVARKAAEDAEVRRIAEEAAATERRRTMIELADSFEGAVGGIIGMVSSSATELQATAQTMTATAT